MNGGRARTEDEEVEVPGRVEEAEDAEDGDDEEREVLEKERDGADAREHDGLVPGGLRGRHGEEGREARRAVHFGEEEPLVPVAEKGLDLDDRDEETGEKGECHELHGEAQRAHPALDHGTAREHHAKRHEELRGRGGHVRGARTAKAGLRRATTTDNDDDGLPVPRPRRRARLKGSQGIPSSLCSGWDVPWPGCPPRGRRRRC